MNNKREIENIIIERFAKLMSIHGFKFYKPRQILYRKTDYGKDIFHFIFLDWYDCIELHPDIGIRHEKVMNYVNDILKVPRYTCFDQYDVVVGQYLKVFSNRKNKWIIKNIKDIDQIINEMYIDTIKYAFPFYEKYSDIKEVYKYTLDNVNEDNLIPFEEYRAIFAIAICKLYNLGDVDKIIENRKKYLESLNLNDLALKIFNYFVSKVKEESSN